jgi:hypothetical protein
MLLLELIAAWRQRTLRWVNAWLEAHDEWRNVP